MKRTGFTTVIALVLLAMITAALSAIAMGLHAEAKRTRSSQIRAELQQLLLAAGSEVNERAQHWPAVVQPTEWSLQMPADLSAAKAQVGLQLTPDAPAAATVEVTARIETQQLSQVIRLQYDERGWHIRDARMDGNR